MLPRIAAGGVRAFVVVALVTSLVAGCGLTGGPGPSGPAGTPAPSMPTASPTEPPDEGADSPGGDPGLSAPPATATPIATPGRSAGPTLPPDVVEAPAGPDTRLPVAIPARIELYTGAVSVMPGQPLELHVSTLARRYRFSIERLDATLPTGGEVMAVVENRTGHDYRSLATYDSVHRTARANWPVTDRVETEGWRPGVYVATATDSGTSVGQAVFVVRTPTLVPGRPAFVFTALTYQAYNLWGGGNLYTYGGPEADRVSFERPYDQADGKGHWARSDDRILAWLQHQGLDLQYTTDYDLAMDPPVIAPRLLIVPRHAEYVTGSLRDWLELNVDNRGYMNVLSYGANGFYWQVRLARPRTAGAPFDIICYKSAVTDPVAAGRPELATTRWRDAPLDRPEGAVLGGQFTEVLGDSYQRFDYTVTRDMPVDLLAGTGWRTGTVIHGLLSGEGDALFPGPGAVAVMTGHAWDPRGRPLEPGVTIRISPAGARVFNVGTFHWADGLAPAIYDMGIPTAGFERFNRNVLAWLGFAAGG